MGLLDQPLISEILETENQRRLESKANRLLRSKKTRRAKRKKHKQKIPVMSYRTYMKSKYWRKRKEKYFSKHGKQCAVCGKRQGVTLHHKRYDSKYGEEPDSHLAPLCQKHHHEFHENHKTKKDMAKATDRYIDHAKQFTSTNLDDLSWV